jgi:nitrogen fixation protein NifU and related proteins
MSDLRDLYQEVVIDHSRRPRNFGAPARYNRHAEGFNPLCGDKLTLYLDVEDGIVRNAGFEGAGCAISMASASLLTEALKGKTEAEAEALFASFHDLVTGKAEADAAALGKLEVLAGVREFPARIKCAILAWHTMRSALNDQGQAVSTE